MKKRIAMVLAALTIVSAILAGCGSKPAPAPSTTPTPAPASAAKPADKQEIILNEAQEPPGLDSAKTTDTVSFDVLNNVEEGFIRIGAGYKAMPGIADKWDVSTDGLTYTFHIRSGAKWSDGKPVTSKDFAYAWLRAMDPNTASEYAYMTYYIKGAEEFNSLDVKAADFKAKYDAAKAAVAIKTPDDNTLTVTLKAPTPYFLGLMAFPTFLPERQDIVEKFNTTENGKLVEKYAAEPANMVYDGPFTISEWVHEDHLTMVKNPNYWDAANVKLQQAKLLMVSDSNTAVQMYETGELDRVGLSGANYLKYKSDPGLITWPDLAVFWLVPNESKPAYANINVRKAISAALDRQAFVDAVFGNGTLPAAGAVPPVLSSGVEGQEYRKLAGNMISPTADKANAQKYWDAAKKELGITSLNIDLLLDQGDIPKKEGEAIQAMLADALPGVTVNIDQVTFKVRLDRTKQKDYDMVFAGWGPDYNDPTTFLDLWKSNSSFNDPGWKNADYDKMLNTAEANPDVKARADQLVQAEKLLMDNMPIIPVYARVRAAVQKPYLKGVQIFAIGAGLDLKGAYVEGKAK